MDISISQALADYAAVLGRPVDSLTGVERQQATYCATLKACEYIQFELASGGAFLLGAVSYLLEPENYADTAANVAVMVEDEQHARL